MSTRRRSPLIDSFASAKPLPLAYSIAAASSYSGSYEPSNILTDKPHDLSSRWSGANGAAGSSANNVPAVAATAGPSRAGTSAAAALAAAAQQAASIGASPPPGGGASSSSSSSAAGGKQYIILKLSQLAVVKSILFGKFHKAHPCNLRDFKVYGGPSSDPNSGLWLRLLRAGLRNDAQPEEFDLRWTDEDGTPFPIRYIKLVPLAAHSPNYNFSVWHVALKGVVDEQLVGRASQEHEEAREGMTMRLMLKHLRSRGHQAAYEALLKSSKLDAPALREYPRGATLPQREGATAAPHQRPFEHPLVTQLYQAIMKGDWDAAEQCLELSAGQDGRGDPDSTAHSLFSSCLAQRAHTASWTRLHASSSSSSDLDPTLPSPRGGHQLIVDSAKGQAYLFGGWDGSQDLCDLWVYYIKEARWRLISDDTRKQGGPGPRSCHKMAYSSRSGLLYVLGRFVDTPVGGRSPSATPGAAGAGAGSSTAAAAAAASPSSPPMTSVARTVADIDRLRATIRLGGPDARRETPAATGASPDPAARASTASPNPASSAAPMDVTSSSTTSSPAPAPPRPAPLPSPPTYQSDFYRFSTRSERWDLLSRDTAADGGPKLIFDHQMLIDDESQMLYVFGGKVAHWDPGHVELSGLWKWDCIQRTWAFGFDDESKVSHKILGRAGHSMLLDGKRRMLWVLAGQRGESYLSDMCTYSLDTRQVKVISQDYSVGGKGPEGGFTQRATMDCEKREIYLFSGMPGRNRGGGSSFWRYKMEEDEWQVVWRGQTTSGGSTGGGGGAAVGGGSSSGRRGSSRRDGDEDDMDVSELDDDDDEDHDMGAGLLGPHAGSSSSKSGEATTTNTSSSSSNATEPRPRYASEMIYDSATSTFFLFGGNPADPTASPSRLGDLWSLKLLRPGVGEALRRAKFTLRQQRFKEMTRGVRGGGAGGAGEGMAGQGMMEALVYLQTQVADVVDHEKSRESRTFRRLVAGLLQGGDAAGGEDVGDDAGSVDSDGLPSMDGDGDDEMLSVSQTLGHPSRPHHADLSRLRPLEAGQRAPALFAQRLQLFRDLLAFYPPEAIEPAGDVGQAIGAALVRGANRR